jgi:predicted amidohydrolase YtcJ
MSGMRTSLSSTSSIATFFLALLLSVPTARAQQNSSDTILFNGNILTGKGLIPDATTNSLTASFVPALAIRNGKVIAIGSNSEILQLKGPSTKIVDLNGAFAMPGFIDAHTHIASAGRQKLTVDLDNVPSLKEMQARIQAFASKAAPGTWIVGAGWDHTKWPTKTLPTKSDLDAVTAVHPALFYRTDGHILIANSAALAAAGITPQTPDPKGGQIDHDASGNLTGIVREDPAMQLLAKVVPPPNHDQRLEALKLAIGDALSHGVTSVEDFSDWDDFLVLEEMERAGTLHLRVSEWLPFNDSLETLQQHRSHHPAEDPLLHTGMLKGFMDGSLGSRTAALAAPYSDDPKNSGLPRYEQATLNKMAIERAEAGFQLGFHAIGDRANHMALEAFETVNLAHQKNNDGSPTTPLSVEHRFRIEHAQVLLPEDFDLYEKLGVIASMQPSHLLTDMNWAADRLGPQRTKYSYAWRSMLNHNIPLAFGTDYPVESINPFRGLYAAITRQNEAGTKTYEPQEKLSLREAIYAYTHGSAYADFREKEKGILAPGFLADLIVLDRDITNATSQELLHTRVLKTIVNGEVVYTAPTSNSAKGQ